MLPVGRLTVVTGANGTGKSSLYRALRLLADCGRGEVVGSLAREGGLQSALWAGPEQLSGSRRTGRVEGTLRTRSISLEMGYATDDFGYLVDLGLPQMAGIESVFGRDPEIKRELIFVGPVPRANATLVRRAGPLAEARAQPGPAHRDGYDRLTRGLPTYRSVLSEFAHPGELPELSEVRNRLRSWRFYDGFRVDAGAPARRPQVGTRTPVLADDGSDLAAAIQTILEAGSGAFSDELRATFADAFDGAEISVVVTEGLFDLAVRQPGMLRALRAAELSDGTLRFLLWAAALLSVQPPSLMVLNEPETSLHPDLVEPLARLIRSASRVTQVVVVTHSAALLAFLDTEDTQRIELYKDCGETQVVGQTLLTAPPWDWGSR